MKRLCALLLALCMLLPLTAFAIDQYTLTVVPSYAGKVYPLGNSGFSITIPADMSAYDLTGFPDSFYAMLTNAQGNMRLQVIRDDTPLEQMANEIIQGVENGQAQEAFFATINNTPFLLTTDTTGCQLAAIFPENNTQTIVFMFSVPEASVFANNTIPYEILSTLAYSN